MVCSPLSHQERQVQDPGRSGGSGAAAPRWRPGHPHSQEGGVLCLPHGEPPPTLLLSSFFSISSPETLLFILTSSLSVPLA